MLCSVTGETLCQKTYTFQDLEDTRWNITKSISTIIGFLNAIKPSTLFMIF